MHAFSSRMLNSQRLLRELQKECTAYLLDEGQLRERRVAVHHLVQDTAQAPYVRRPAYLHVQLRKHVCDKLLSRLP